MVTIKDAKTALLEEAKVFGPMESLEHEQVLFCSDNATGLRAIIAVHNTTLGPSLGGTRMWTYASDLDALQDVLRLSRGMTFKAAISGLNLGGGKAVIIGNSRTDKSEAMMRRFGKFVNNLGGKYITAEDVGTTTRDMQYVNMETNHVTGLPGKSGDPSPFTAYGVYLGMKAALHKQTGSDRLMDKKVIVQGLGNVGYYLCELLHKENASIYVYDIFPDKVDRAVTEFNATPISESEVYTMPADIFAPCALGAILNEKTIPGMNVSIVAGGANNQLADEINDALRLRDKGILWAPDFVINAGGLMNVYAELEGYNESRVREKVQTIYDTTLNIFAYAEKNQVNISEASMALAKQRINAVGNLNLYL